MKQIFTVMAALAMCVAMMAQSQLNLSERLQKTHDLIYSLPNRNQIDSAFLQKLIQLQFDGDNTTELKSATALKPRLDKVETPGYSKTEYIYDEQGLNTTEFRFNWDNDKAVWVNQKKIEFYFNEQRKRIGYAYFNWNNNDWVGDMKIDYLEDEHNSNYNLYFWNTTTKTWYLNSGREIKYDDNANELMTVYYGWNYNTQQLVGQSKFEAEYDANSNQTLKIYYQWNADAQNWVYSDKIVRTFNSSSKETSRITYEWKSSAPVGWVEQSKKLTQYDAVSGNVLTVYSSDWISGDWAENSKVVYSYNAQGMCDKKESFYKSGADWVSSYRNTYVYNSSNQVTDDVLESWFNNQWNSRTKIVKAYDANGNVTLQEEYRYNSGWQIQWRSTFTFNAQNKKLTGLNEALDNGSLVNNSKFESAYDINGNETLSASYYWSQGDWVGSNKSVYEFDSYGNTILKIFYNWDLGTNNWIEYRKFEDAFDVNKKQTLSSDYNWDPIEKLWYGNYKTISEFDGIGNLIKQQTFNWHMASKNWVSVNLQTTTFNNTYGKADLVLPEWGSYYSKPVSGTIKTYDVKLQQESDYTTTYYYSNMQVTGTDEKMALPALTIWPNPASDVIALEGISSVAKVYISSLNGSLVLTAEVQAGQSIPVSQLAKGVYLVKAVSDGGTFESKLVIK